MKNIFNAVLRMAVRIALHLYFGRIKVFGKENIPKNKAVLLISNHQNALIDPILLATHTHLNPHFLTRASVFKNPIISKMLHFIRMIPVYRIRDGVDNMDKNKSTFAKSVSILSEKGCVIIFGEGGHSMQRDLRPLRKGFARIAYQAIETHPDLEVVILPVGINYSNHKKSGSKVGIYFGKPFLAQEFYPNFDRIIKETHARLKPLVSEIPKENYQENLNLLIQNKVDLTNPEEVKSFLSQPEINPPQKKVSKPYFTNKVMKIFHLPVYWIWLAIQPKVKDATFTATFKFVIGLVAVPLWYLILLFVLPMLNMSSWMLSWTFLAFVYLLSNRSGQA